MLNFLAQTTEDVISNELSSFGKFIENTWNSFLAFLPSLLIAIVVLIVGILLSKLVIKMMTKGFKKSKIEPTVIHFTSSLVKILLYLVVFSIVLNILQVPSASIIAVIGSAGVAIGFALQNVLGNLAGGFIILFAKPFKIGDYIQSGGVEGTVANISILYTLLHTNDNKAIFVPNGTLSSASVMNYSTNPERRVDLTFCISYNDNYDQAVEIINNIIASDQLILKTPLPFVRMSSHDQSSINIEVRAWTKQADYWTVHFNLLENVRKEFIKNKIEIPYNQLDVHIFN